MILFNQIPNKSLFKTNEVCEICQIKPYVLRFWDTEFEQIQSVINSSGKKLYQKKDILVISVLKELLFDRKLTIEKARHELALVDFTKIIETQSEQFSNNSEIQGESFEEVDQTGLSSGNTDSGIEIPTFSDTQFQQIEHSKELINGVLERITQLKSRYNWV